jgi:hypothetical protein
MAAYGSGGARRWIARKPVDNRPIVGIYERNTEPDLWRRFGVTCYAMGAGTLGLAAYVWIADAIAGHIR